MIVLRIGTARFTGIASMRCRTCDRRIIFPTGCSVVVYSYRVSLDQVDGQLTVVYEAGTHELLHDCRLVRLYRCLSCAAIVEIMPPTRRTQQAGVPPTCACGGFLAVMT